MHFCLLKGPSTIVGSETLEHDSEAIHVSGSREGLAEIIHRGQEAGVDQVQAEMFEMCLRNQLLQEVEAVLVQTRSKWCMAVSSAAYWLVVD